MRRPFIILFIVCILWAAIFVIVPNYCSSATVVKKPEVAGRYHYRTRTARFFRRC